MTTKNGQHSKMQKSKGCLAFPYSSFACIVCLLSAVACGLGIADVVIGSVAYYQIRGCPDSAAASPFCTSDALRLTWVAVGIWAAIPLFVGGILAYHVKNGVDGLRDRTGMFIIVCFFGALLFGPAMTVISAVEVWKGTGVFYTIPPSASAASNSSSTSPPPLLSGRASSDVTKLAVTLTIAGIGALLTLIDVMALVWHCCSCLTCFQMPPCAHSSERLDGQQASTASTQDVRSDVPQFAWTATQPTSAAGPGSNIYSEVSNPFATGKIGQGPSSYMPGYPVISKQQQSAVSACNHARYSSPPFCSHVPCKTAADQQIQLCPSCLERARQLTGNSTVPAAPRHY